MITPDALQNYYLLDSPLGQIGIADNGQFITGVSFADGKTSLQNTTQNPSPLAQMVVQQLSAYFEGKLEAFNLPIRQAGTPFQLQVWNLLQQIPFGTTWSYMQLSRKLGNEKAIRAVGTANGKNNVVIIVPCHRVIGTNGQLVGFSGGLWRKQWLLEHEARWKHGMQTLF
ncbi:MAG: hypothetical protein RLY16_1804 [Bacteroidota bacterium]